MRYKITLFIESQSRQKNDPKHWTNDKLIDYQMLGRVRTQWEAVSIRDDILGHLLIPIPAGVNYSRV